MVLFERVEEGCGDVIEDTRWKSESTAVCGEEERECLPLVGELGGESDDGKVLMRRSCCSVWREDILLSGWFMTAA